MLEINNTVSRKIDRRKLEDITARFLRAYKLRGSVSLALIGSARMKSLNRDYRGIDRPTDVLSFPGETPDFLGEIIINPGEAEKVGKYEEILGELSLPPFRNRLAAQKYIFYFLFVHGLLHLAGYDDVRQEERREILVRGRDFLKKVL